MTDSEICSLTGLEISQGLSSGKFSSEEVTLAFINRIKVVDDKVHAFLSYDEEDVLNQREFGSA